MLVGACAGAAVSRPELDCVVVARRGKDYLARMVTASSWRTNRGL